MGDAVIINQQTMVLLRERIMQAADNGVLEPLAVNARVESYKLQAWCDDIRCVPSLSELHSIDLALSVSPQLELLDETGKDPYNTAGK
jgi:hypothetical protein